MTKITSQLECPQAAELTSGILSDPSALRTEYEAWTQEVGASVYTLDVPYNGHCIRMSVAAKGDFQHAKNVTMAIPGFAMDNRSYAPSLKDFVPSGDNAFVSVSLIGAGTIFPDAINPTPQELSEIYAAAARAVAPQVDPQRGLNIVGNSMGGLIAMGSALVLATDVEHPIVADVGLDNSVTWDPLNEMHTYLYQLLATIQPMGRGVLHAGLATSFSFGPTRNNVVNVLYGIKQEKGFIHSDKEDRDYTRDLFHQEGLYPFLAKEVTAVDTWDDYFLDHFPNQVTGNGETKGDDRIASLTLPGRVVLLDSGGDRLLWGLTTQKLADHLIPSGSANGCARLVLPVVDAHVENLSGRAALLAKELTN